MKNIMRAAGWCGLCLLLAGTALAQTGIAVVDYDKIRKEYQEFAGARDEALDVVKLEHQDFNERYQGVLERIKKLQTKYREGEITEELYQQERGKLRLNLMELGQEWEVKQKRWDDYAETITEPYIKQVHEAVQKIGAERGLTLVVKARYAEYWSPKIDITDDVLKLLNKGAGGGEATKN